MSQGETKRLKASNRLEACELLVQAFGDYPFAESYGLDQEATRRIIEASINVIDVEAVWAYGIWKDDKVVCLSI